MPSRIREVQKVSDADICCKTIRSSNHDGQYGRVPETEKEAIIHLQLIFVLRNFSFVCVCVWHVGSNSLTKDLTWAPCTGGAQSLNPWTPREVPPADYYMGMRAFFQKMWKIWIFM